MAKQNGIKRSKQLRNSEQALKMKWSSDKYRFMKVWRIITSHDLIGLRQKEKEAVERSKLYYDKSSSQHYLNGEMMMSRHFGSPRIDWSRL